VFIDGQRSRSFGSGISKRAEKEISLRTVFQVLIKMIGMADQLYVNFWLIFGVKKEVVKRDRHQMCVEIRDRAREGGYRMVASSGFLN
jgi:hypothetical protein